MPARPQRTRSQAKETSSTALWERAAGLGIGAAVFLSLIAVDTRAEAAFDAPKRLAVLVGVSLAAAAVVAAGAWPRIARSHTVHRAVAAAAALCVLALGASALLSDHRAIAVDALRTALILSFAPIVAAASSLVFRVTIGSFVAGCTVNAALVLLQGGGLRLFDYSTTGGRRNTSALVGNDGLLSILLAIAVVVMIYRLLSGKDTRSRDAALLALLCAALLVNINFTAISVVIAGATVLSISAPRRLVVAGVLTAALASAALLALPASRHRVGEFVGHIRAGDVDRVTSYRLGPWAAALAMVQTRPLFGHGPGTYGAEYVSHLAVAQITWRERFANPHLSGSYVHAHNDVLQGLGEWGAVPVLFGLSAVLTIVALLVRRRRTIPDAMLLLALLASIAVASLTWFAIHVPALNLLLLVVLGRGWQASADGSPS